MYNTNSRHFPPSSSPSLLFCFKSTSTFINGYFPQDFHKMDNPSFLVEKRPHKFKSLPHRTEVHPKSGILYAARTFFC